MPSYNASQRASIAQFVSFTQSKESIAGRLLKSHGWNVEQAVDAFYQSGTSNNTSSPAQNTLNKLFDTYREQPKEQPDTIGAEGAQRYLADLNVALDEVVVLALSDLLQCPAFGEFTRANFVSGWQSVSGSGGASDTYDATAKQAKYITQLRRRLATDPSYFKEVYRATFRFAKPDNQKSVPMDSALEFWSLFFGGAAKGGMEWNSRRTNWLDLWLEFYETKTKRPVNKDLWNMVMELVSKTREEAGESLEWWNENGAWPMAVDEFVEFVKERRKAQADGMDIS